MESRNLPHNFLICPLLFFINSMTSIMRKLKRRRFVSKNNCAFNDLRNVIKENVIKENGLDMDGKR